MPDDQDPAVTPQPPAADEPSAVYARAGVAAATSGDSNDDKEDEG